MTSGSDSVSVCGQAHFTTEKQYSGILSSAHLSGPPRVSDSVIGALDFLTASGMPVLSPARCAEVGAVGSANVKPLSSSIVVTQPSLPPEPATTSSARVLRILKSVLKRPRPCLLTKLSQILSLIAAFAGDSSTFQTLKKSTSNVSASWHMRESESTASAMACGEDKEERLNEVIFLCV